MSYDDYKKRKEKYKHLPRSPLEFRSDLVLTTNSASENGGSVTSTGESDSAETKPYRTPDPNDERSWTGPVRTWTRSNCPPWCKDK